MRANIFSPEYMLSNAFAIVVLLLAIKRPFGARALLLMLFAGAALFNIYMATRHPEKYLVYGDLAAFPLYETFIKGSFSRHIMAYVLPIAIIQLLISTGLFMKGKWQHIALIGAIVFFVAIAPLGAGAAFPFTIILAIACLVLLFSHSHDTIKVNKHENAYK